MTSAAKKRSPRGERAKVVTYLRHVEELRSKGHFEPVTYPKGCGRCGGDLTVQDYPAPPGRGSWAVKTESVATCQVCRVDRVKRWADLINAAKDAGLPYRGGLDVATMEHVPTARALAEIGLIRYDRTDGAWELTRDGARLLRKDDEENRRVALADLAERKARFDAEHERSLAYINAQWPESMPQASAEESKKGT